MLSRLGKYLLLEHVNQGGMADVFLAKTFGFGGADQLIALKCIRPEVHADHGFISMFIDEAKLSALLSHAHIAKTYELGRINDSYFIAMEYVSGRDLRALIDRARARGTEIPVGLSLFIIAAVLEGLDYAHRKSDLKGQPLHIVHSDVSPKNVLVGYAGEVKLIDFGIARAAQGAAHVQGEHGKVGYMAPEQVRGEPIDARSDVFAAGSLLFELLTQARLFEGGTDAIVRDKVRNAEIFPPTLIAPNLASDIELIVMRALGRTPDERYPNAESMHRDVVEVMLRRYGHTQARDVGSFVRKLFDDEHREDLARIERAMQISTIPERVPEHRPGVERTAMVDLATILPLGEENTAPEATRLASILPSGAVLAHPFSKPTVAATALAASTPAPPAPVSVAPPQTAPVSQGIAPTPAIFTSSGGNTSSWAPPSAPALQSSNASSVSTTLVRTPTTAAAAPPVSYPTPALAPAPVYVPVTSREPPEDSNEELSANNAPTVIAAWPLPPGGSPAPSPVVARRPQLLSEIEHTDVDERSDDRTREVGTDPHVAPVADTARHAVAAHRADDDHDDGDTAIVRTEGTRIATLTDAPQAEDDDFTDRIHKSLAILGVHEDSDSNIEPTQVAYRDDSLKRTHASVPVATPAAVLATATPTPTPRSSSDAAPTPTPAQQAPALNVRRGTVERLESLGITGGTADIVDDDVDDATDRVLRSSAGGIEQVPREVTIIDHSRRTPAVDDWARESRGQRRSTLRRAVVIGLLCLFIGGAVIGGLWLQRTGRLRFGSAAAVVGSLVIMSQPAGAEVLIDGKVWGTTPFSSPKVPLGLRRVVVRAASGKQRVIEVVVKEREVVTREVSLAD